LPDERIYSSSFEPFKQNCRERLERGRLVRVGVQASAYPPENKLKLELQQLAGGPPAFLLQRSQIICFRSFSFCPRAFPL
jgi:hypothetical protein